MTPQEISVIIAALNEAERIEAAIESAWDNGAGEVIVCDGGSEDNTAQLARQSATRVVDAPRGRGNQLAIGAAAATRPMLLFLHADNRLGVGCLDLLCRSVNDSADPRACWGGFRQRIDAGDAIYRWLEWGNALRVRWRGMPFGDQAMFVARPLYDAVGGFQMLPLMEDVRLAQALRRRCWPLLIDGRVQVDPRRWNSRGVVRQTARNWGIQIAHRLGVSEHRLAKWYR
ncbi:TIGR04283 family arsenosugar biosynthesis glycosyltransferase [Stieleria mannarensis]|uniref:TIGR04283 family arsenosugar biosynthesis glycosyltransferase n=1 Tax=Stieleria mannarensis TaxID=2755585 RepID=UPI0016019F70|nr:TIGR04283 family arsenosugar biosynthesis glycosyltransferase [Rhodopirellula sp. JC639]